MRTEALESLWAEGEPKPDAVTAGARLMPWASTDNGEFLYWLVRPEAAGETWPVLVNEARGAGWEHHAMGCVAFLVATLTGEVRSEVLSSRYPTTPHRFRPTRSTG